MLRIILILLIWALADVYFIQALDAVPLPLPYVYGVFWTIEALLIAAVLYLVLSGRRPEGAVRGVFMSLLMISLIPKIIVIPFLAVEDMVRLGALALQGLGTGVHALGRSALVSQVALGVATMPLLGLVYGLVRGKYQYRVHRLTLTFDDLPDAFDGFTITQLSDIHAGSFDNAAAVTRGVALANEQQSDLLLFTGDLVNNRAEEMDPWKETFTQLHAPYGKFSILGNHDYGDYTTWASPAAKAQNLEDLKAVHAEIGMRLLLDEHLTIEKDGQHITLAGVENWGKGGFHKYGNLNQALTGVNPEDFTILMSHDPSHWKAQVLPHTQHIHLTLAGHTHGMQFGIDLPRFKWSPVKYMYPEWADLYEEKQQYLYVNRGFGFHGYPGRVGILPEITVITLRKGH